MELGKNLKIDRKALVFAIDSTEFLPAEIIENTARQYACGLSGKSVVTGVDLDVQEYCPDFIKQVGVSPASPDFAERVDEFWSDWRFDIPISKYENGNAVAGVIIDGSYEIKNGKLYPTDIQEYIAFNLMMKDNGVGKSDEDYRESKDQFDFFIIDISEKEATEAKLADAAIETTMKLAELFGRENYIDLIKQIFLSSRKYDYYDIQQFNDAGLKTEVYKFAQKYPDLFKGLVDSKELVMRSLISEMITLEVLTTVGAEYYNGQERIGAMKECVLYFKNEANKIAVEKLKSTLEEVKLRNVIR